MKPRILEAVQNILKVFAKYLQDYAKCKGLRYLLTTACIVHALIMVLNL